MLKQFLEHCDVYNLIPDFQSAYRENYSTETSLVKLANDILTSMDQGRVTMIAILDLSAVFDMVDHSIFLQIMNKNFGISGNALQLFESDLSPRGFKVCVNEQYSKEKDLTFSVPQGSCAGAPLFTAYCSPIEDHVANNVNLNGFADDHSIRMDFNPNNSMAEHDVYSDISESLLSIKSWMHQMRLKLNGEKTEFMLFGNKPQVNKCQTRALEFDGETIPRSEIVKYLGGYLDRNMTFEKHINTKCKAAMANFVKIKTIRKYITVEVTTLLCLTMCISHLDYSNVMLFGLPKRSLNKMQRVQNMCAKLTLRRSRYDSSTNALKELHWLPIVKRIEYKICLLTFKALSGRAPKYLSDLIQLGEFPMNTRQSKDDLLLKQPRWRTKTFGPRSFSNAAPTVWNTLPYKLRSTNNIETLKLVLKLIYFRVILTLSKLY